MKPRTNLQKEVFELSKKMPDLSDYQFREAVKKVAPHIVKRSSKGVFICLDCGHEWKSNEKDDEITCPHCSARLNVSTDRTRNFDMSDYFMVVTTCRNFQVLRMYLIRTVLRKGKKANHFISEVFQRWIKPGKRDTIVGLRRRSMSGYYIDSWEYSGRFEVREEKYVHSLCPYKIIGKINVIPELKRNGFNCDFKDCNPAVLFNALLTDSRIETLWKMKEYEIVNYILKCGFNNDKYWDSIKVAMRHKYKIKDFLQWIDMLRLLSYMKKDLRNPKYICPENLSEAHDYWDKRYSNVLEKERAKREKERHLQDIKKAEEYEVEYKEKKGKYFNLKFQDNDITIKPLVSVDEFLQEGINMHHCVFSCGYYKVDDSLILHALVNDSSIATIELNLNNMEILQCRGACNSVPEHNDRIVSLINANKWQIEKIRFHN